MKDKLDIPYDEYLSCYLWTYAQYLFAQHHDLINTIGEIRYIPDFIYLPSREFL